MRIILPPDLQQMCNEMWPYMVLDGFNTHLSESAPPDIVEKHNKVMAYYQKEQEEFEKEALGLA